jgi:uncharacterized membrane protein YedE/YeeE
MKKKLLTGGLALALAVGSIQSASAMFLGCGTTEYPVGDCVAGWQATAVQLYIFGFEIGDSVPGDGQAC